MFSDKRWLVKTLSISFIILSALILISLCFSLVKGIYLTGRKKELQAQLSLLEQTIQKNQAEIEYKQSDDYIDRYAREHLDKKNEDEEVYKGVEK